MNMIFGNLAAALSMTIAAGTVFGAGASLRLATQEFAPFSYQENGKAAGATVEIMQAICEAVAATCSFEILPWRRANADVESGRVDGLFPLLADNERNKKFFLSEPIVKTAYSFFVPKNSNWVYKTPADLRGMTVGVFGPSGTATSLQELAAKSQDVKLEIELTNRTAFKKLIGGRYGEKAAVISNRDVGLALIKQDNLIELRSAGDAKAIYYSFAMSRKKIDSERMDALSKALRDLKKSGKIAAILTKYGLETASDVK